jgi:glycosyltransferase involved in cell wall biosynthesis
VKVVHVLPCTDDAGAENQARYLIKAFRDDDANVDVELAYFREGRAHARFVELNVPMHRLGSRGPLAIDARRRAKALADLAEPPAILHTWLYEANVVGALATRHLPGTRLVITQRSGTMMREDLMRSRITAWLRRRADHALANSRDGVDLLLDLGFDPQRITLVPNALPEERTRIRASRAEVRSHLRIRDDEPVICVVGRPDETKDFPGLFEAMVLLWRARPELRLVLVGPTVEGLDALGASPPEGVRVLGWQDDPASIMAACDVVAIPSCTEGHSNVADEALMLGLPVVTTDTGQHPTLVSASGGRIVPIRRPDLLAEAIVELLAQPPDPNAVRHAARRSLSSEGACAVTRRVYDSLICGFDVSRDPRPNHLRSESTDR